MNLDEPQNQEPRERSQDVSEPDENSGSDELFTPTPATTDLQTATNLKDQIQQLRQEIAGLQAESAKMKQQQMALTETMQNVVSETLSQLEQRRQALQIEVEKLERRRERIRQEMRTSFAGVSQDLAIRVQGFKDYLVGSLQDLVSTAEQLELIPESPEPIIESDRSDDTFGERPFPAQRDIEPEISSTPQFGQQGFQEESQQIRRLLDQYRTLPDYYGPPWQLRRTFEPIHAKRVSTWFFNQGGRGALRTMGSRLQNILIASAITSVLRTLYDRRLRTLILANSPERLGEWRRGFQDCLGLDRRDFSPERGVTLFEDANVVALKADRLVQEGKLPFIVIDDSEEKISLSLLQYPLWLGFAPEPQSQQQQQPLYREF
ncbi:hypothetical protein M595_5881 [Lyngbya aestuarii BL J]|uniref:DUF3086 domain-containing protein n=1 Tax=Lyngbya aestuarii BL J TaxID=1348334 RepID=U7Q8M6_9CYAN|nr:DUF3086 domain-containing protein [Lyngbya aestuarii]ERT04184.1 hypothetical protein M595_5881 [Lyngbya aestuarii BL J]